MNENPRTELTMVERVEDAIVDAVMEQELFNATIAKQMGKLWISGEARINLKAVARDVIEAMREPTAHMLFAGGKAQELFSPDYEKHNADEIWEYMIDAALSTEAIR